MAFYSSVKVVLVKNMELHKLKLHCQNICIFSDFDNKHVYLQGMIRISSRMLRIVRCCQKHFYINGFLFYFIFTFWKVTGYLLRETVKRLWWFPF